MKFKVYIFCILWLCVGNNLFAQQPPPDPLAENFFPPELVMQHQQAIGLSEDQRALLKTEIRKAQTRFTELQWQLQDEGEKILSLVKQERIDEQKVLAELDKILGVEREIKRAQISLAVKIKNSLTPEQQARLQDIKNKARGK